MSQARSQVFLRASLAVAGWTKAFIVPQDTTALLKSVVAHNYGSPTTTLVVVISSSVLSAALDVVVQEVPQNKPFEWSGWTVVYPGDAILANSSAGGCSILVTGALLAGAPPYPPADGPGLLTLADAPWLEPLPARTIAEIDELNA